jgi:hypothetical protein
VYTTISDRGRPHDPDKARRLLAQAGHPGGLDLDPYLQPFVQAVTAKVLPEGDAVNRYREVWEVKG